MDSAIYKYHREAVLALRNKIIGKCKKCVDGFIPIDVDEDTNEISYVHCSCREEYQHFKGVLLANLPRKRWEHYEGKNLRIRVTDPYDYKKKFGLYTKFINKICNNLNKAIENSVGLFMFGPPGTGKSTAGYHIIRKAVEEDRSCYYVYLKELIGLIIKSYSDENFKPLFEEIVEVDVLVVDELSLIGRVTPHAVAEFTNVCKRRVEGERCTILISNYLDVEELKENFGAPMESLMHEGFQGVRFVGKRDLREVRSDRLKSFFK